MMKKSSKLFVGMDVHKDSIDVATGDEGAGEVRHYGAVGGDLAAVLRLVRKLKAAGKALVFVTIGKFICHAAVLCSGF